MINITVVYPCKKCTREIPSGDEFCKYCGTRQPDLESRLFYNVFYRQNGSGPFNLLYGGDPILEIGDAQELALKLTVNASSNSEYFIGSFQPADVETSGYDSMFSVKNWIQIKSGQLGSDQGPQQKIQVTSLEG